MRLLIQAQELAKQTLLREVFCSTSFANTSAREVLMVEMGHTGVEGETYSLSKATSGGPAFLVYYSPAVRPRYPHRTIEAHHTCARCLRARWLLFTSR